MGNSQGNPLKRIVREVHRRSLWQVLAIYVAAGWVVFEVVQTLTEGLGLPGWFPSFAFVLLLIGLPVVLATAFLQEGGPTARGSNAPLIDATGREIERQEPHTGSTNPARRIFTWRNAILGGIGALALWGVVAAGWILFGGGQPVDANDLSSSRPSLAVLPFDNLSPDPDNAYFADGVHEEMLTQLSKVEGIDLISRTSVLKYEETEKGLTEIAGELGVATILEGSVRRAGDAVRITVQLNDAREDRHLWAESYDREFSDIFQIQTDVASRVVEELKGVLTPEERTELTRRPTDDLEAYAHYLRGHEHFRRLLAEEEDTRAATEAYERAVELDPDFAAAWARLVQTRIWLAWVWGQPEERARARAALDRLERIAPESAALRFARGIWLYYGVQKYEESLWEFEALADLWPADPHVTLYRGGLYRRLARWDDAVRTMQSALDLDPASAAKAVTIAETYMMLRRFEEAERYATTAVSLEPAPFYWWFLIWTRLAQGDTAAARSAVDSAGQRLNRQRLESGGWWALWQAYAGRSEDFLKLYREPYRDPLSVITWVRSWDLGLAAVAADGRSDVVEALADTLRSSTERLLLSFPPDFPGKRSQLLARLAVANAYLGNDQTALRLGRDAVDLLPVSRDAFLGPDRVRTLAHVYAVVGRQDDAVDRLRYLLSIPARGVTIPLLRIDPRWDPLRAHAGFQALLEESG